MKPAIALVTLFNRYRGGNIANPFVVSGAGWTVTGSDGTHIATFGDGNLRYQSDTTTPALTISQASALVVGVRYEISVNVLSWTVGSLKINGTGGNFTFAESAGLVTGQFVADSTTLSFTRTTGVVDVTIASILLRRLVAQ